MKKHKNIILLFVLSFICSFVFAQQNKTVNTFFVHPKLNSTTKDSSTKVNLYSINNFQLNSVDCYTNQLGFFCKKELQIQKKISLPLFFRLGSLDYTNYIENKPNTTFYKLKN